MIAWAGNWKIGIGPAFVQRQATRATGFPSKRQRPSLACGYL